MVLFKNNVYIILLLTICVSFAKIEGLCELPRRWRGGWFQSGVREVVSITRNELSTKGICVQSWHEKFIFRDKERGCHKCVVISQKHQNILQYKETFCEQTDDLESLCSEIPGDALLFSLFRRDAPPTPCQLSGPLTFSYNQGYGLCSTPVTMIDSCESESRLLFKYQACADVPKTESSVEEVECIGHWKEGSTRYFVAKIDSRRALTDEDRFRCFAWEFTHGAERARIDYRMAQSGDATCNGVFSAYDGSRTLMIKKVAVKPSCSLPQWVLKQRHWHALDRGVQYSVSRHNSSLTLLHSMGGEDDVRSSFSPTRLVCERIIDDTSRKVTAVLRSTKECNSGYVCTIFYKRDDHIIEIQQGSLTSQASDACTPNSFNQSSAPHVTLTVVRSPTLSSTECPLEGMWKANGAQCDNSVTHLRVGCDVSKRTMDFVEACDQDNIKEAFVCHGSWKEGKSTYVVVAPKNRSTFRLCLVASSLHSSPPSQLQYAGQSAETSEGRKSPQNETLWITTHRHSCPRHSVPPTTTLSVNLTSYSQCSALNGSFGWRLKHYEGLLLSLCLYALQQTRYLDILHSNFIRLQLR